MSETPAAQATTAPEPGVHRVVAQNPQGGTGGQQGAAQAPTEGVLPPPVFREKASTQRDSFSGAEAIAHAGTNGAAGLSAEERSAALDWLLSDDPDDLPTLTRTIEINVGSSGDERWINWTIQAVDLDQLRRIQRMGQRRTRRGGDDVGDEMMANLRVIAAGTINPNPVEVAQALGVGDPAAALLQKFRAKPGLVGQIAGEILALSGFDDEDVREAQAARD